MTATGNIKNFTTVDGAPDASWFIDFMDAANAQPEYRDINADLAAALGDLAGKTVLEVGCGTGDDAREIAGLVGPTGKVVATDLSATMVDEARKRSVGSDLPIDFRIADLAGLDFPDGTFDGAWAKLVLMHTVDIETALDELVRVLRPGGRIAVYDIDFDTAIVDHPDVAATREVLRCYADGPRNNWSGRQLYRRMNKRNLTDITVSPTTVCHDFRLLPHALGRPAEVGAGEWAARAHRQPAQRLVAAVVRRARRGPLLLRLHRFRRGCDETLRHPSRAATGPGRLRLPAPVAVSPRSGTRRSSWAGRSVTFHRTMSLCR